MRIINIKKSSQLELFYSQILKVYFPLEDELDSIENFFYYIKHQTKNHNFKIFGIYDKFEFVGGVVFDWFRDTKTIFIEYIAISTSHRNKGLSHILIHKALKTYNCDYVLIEVEDPNKLNTPETISRVKFWEKAGFKKIDFAYIQPALIEGQKSVENLMLMCKVVGKKVETSVIPANTLASNLKNYFTYSMCLNNLSELENCYIINEKNIKLLDTFEN